MPEKKKQAAKRPKKAAAATAKGKKGKNTAEAEATPQLARPEPMDTTSSAQLSSSLPMMPTVTNTTPSIEAMGSDFDAQFTKQMTGGDPDLEELDGDIDFSMWLSYGGNAPAPHQSSPSTGDFEKDLDFFAPVTAPTTTQKNPAVVPFSPSVFPVLDDVVCLLALPT